MAVMASDGGGGVPKPTVTTTGDSARANKSRATTPVSTASTTTRPAKTSGSAPRSTAYNRRPVDSDDNLSLRDAVRTRRTTPKTTSTSTTDSTPNRPAKSAASKPRSSRPATATTGTPAKSSAAKPTANDGRAERLNSGNHVGTRDERIAELREVKAELETEETQIEGRIEELEDEIDSQSGIAGSIKTGVEIATAPVSFVAGLFGKENPVAAGAEALAETVMGLEGDREDLKAQESELDAQQAEIEAEIKKLENEQVLNFLADTAHVVDMDDEVADFIENGATTKGDLNVQLRVANETGTGSDGVFDSGTNTITVDSKLIEEAKEKMDDLRKEGIVDGDGNIVDAEGFDLSAAGDDIIKSVSLLAVHELNHATQHAKGEFNGAFESARAIVDQAAASIAPGTSLEAAGNILQSAQAQGEQARTEAIEVESYRLQEQNDLRSGATKKAFITIDEQGAPLPEDEQLANVLAYQEGRPLVHGPTAGYVRASAGGDHDEHDHDGDGSTDGAHSHDQVADGFRGPGFREPGFRGPGFRGPGEVADGFRGPGFRGPGEVADGFRGPGFRGPGHTAD